MLRYNNDDDVVALKWQLNSRHPVCDICDVYANADFYGLGRGIYPKDKFPTLPAHPHCMCKILPVYDFEVDIHRVKEKHRKRAESDILIHCLKSIKSDILGRSRVRTSTTR